METLTAYEKQVYEKMRSMGFDHEESFWMSKAKSRLGLDSKFADKLNEYIHRYGFGDQTRSMLESELGIGLGDSNYHQDIFIKRIWNVLKERFD